MYTLFELFLSVYCSKKGHTVLQKLFLYPPLCEIVERHLVSWYWYSAHFISL